MKRLLITGFLRAGPRYSAWALTIDAELETPGIGIDGTEGEDDNQTRSELVVEMSDTNGVDNILIDLDAWGTGQGLGVDLSNIDASDVELMTSGGVPINVDLQSFEVDNAA